MDVQDVDIINMVRGDMLQRLLPRLNPTQLTQLKALCEMFDNSYKELVAAHAARDAVSKVRAVWAWGVLVHALMCWCRNCGGVNFDACVI